MKKNKSVFILTVIISIAIFILVFIQFGNIIEIILPNVENLNYQVTNFSSQFYQRVFFSIVVGLAPFLVYITWRISPITNFVYRVYSVLIAILLMIVAIVFRNQTIKLTSNQLLNSETQTGKTNSINFSLDNLHFEYYLLGGLILSCIVSFLVFKDKTIINPNLKKQ